MRAFNVLLGQGAVGCAADGYGCGDVHGHKNGSGVGAVWRLPDRTNGNAPYVFELEVRDAPDTPDAWLSLSLRLQGWAP